MSAADRTCKACQTDSLLSVREARAVYGSLSRFGADALLEDAQLLCEWCRAVKMDGGDWQRLMSVGQRAYNLSQAGNKSKAEYKEKLTRGSLPESDDSGGTSGRVESTGKSW